MNGMKPSSWWTGLLQMIILMDHPLANDPPFPSSLFFFFAKTFSFSKYVPLFPLLLIYSPEKKTIFCPQINSSFFFLSFVLFWRKYIFLFHLRFISPQQKRIPSLDTILFLLCSSCPLVNTDFCSRLSLDIAALGYWTSNIILCSNVCFNVQVLILLQSLVP